MLASENLDRGCFFFFFFFFFTEGSRLVLSDNLGSDWTELVTGSES